MISPSLSTYDEVFKVQAEGVTLSVQVKPRSSKSEVRGVREGRLEVAVAAPPIDGEANAELLRVLARFVGVARSSLEVVSGAGSRQKVVFARALSESSLLQRLRR